MNSLLIVDTEINIYFPLLLIRNRCNLIKMAKFNLVLCARDVYLIPDYDSHFFSFLLGKRNAPVESAFCGFRLCLPEENLIVLVWKIISFLPRPK